MEIADFLTSDYFNLVRISQGHLINNSGHPNQIFKVLPSDTPGGRTSVFILGCLLPQTLQDICYQIVPVNFFWLLRVDSNHLV